MEPKLSKQNEVLLSHLKNGNLILTQDQYELLRQALLLKESMGIASRFIVTLAGFLGAAMALFTFWPWGHK